MTKKNKSEEKNTEKRKRKEQESKPRDNGNSLVSILWAEVSELCNLKGLEVDRLCGVDHSRGIRQHLPDLVDILGILNPTEPLCITHKLLHTLALSTQSQTHRSGKCSDNILPKKPDHQKKKR